MENVSKKVERGGSYLCDAYAVFCDVFGSDIPYERFRHKHLDNPYIKSDIATLVEYHNGVPVGTNSFMGGVLICGGKKLDTVLSCDTAVKESYRGQHIFSSLIQEAIRLGKERGVDLMYGMPNNNSYPGFMKMGFYEVGHTQSYGLFIAPLRFACGLLTHRERKTAAVEERTFLDQDGFTWQVSGQQPFTEEDFSIINDRPGIHAIRSREFFAWKVDYFSPEVTYICVRQEGKLYAYFVLRNRGSVCLMCDWYMSETGKRSRRVMKRLTRFLRSYWDLIIIRNVNPANDEPKQLAGGGLTIKKKRNHPVVFTLVAGKLSPEEIAYLQDFRNWSIRDIDSDTILH